MTSTVDRTTTAHHESMPNSSGSDNNSDEILELDQKTEASGADESIMESTEHRGDDSAASEKGTTIPSSAQTNTTTSFTENNLSLSESAREDESLPLNESSSSNDRAGATTTTQQVQQSNVATIEAGEAEQSSSSSSSPESLATQPLRAENDDDDDDNLEVVQVVNKTNAVESSSALNDNSSSNDNVVETLEPGTKEGLAPLRMVDGEGILKPPPTAPAEVLPVQNAPQPKRSSAQAAMEVIELLDDDDDDDDDNSEPSNASNSNDDIIQASLRKHVEKTKRQKLSNDSSANVGAAADSGAHASYLARNSYMQTWMKEAVSTHGPPPSRTPIVPGSSFAGLVDSVATAARLEQMYRSGDQPRPPPVPIAPPQPLPPPMAATTATAAAAAPPIMALKFGEPQYIPFPPGFKPTWKELIPTLFDKPPPPQVANHRFQQKFFQLSLLNVNEFTITGLPVSFDAPPTPISGLRVAIRQISRQHGGKAVYERDIKEGSGGGGKWRIPLAAYHAFVAYLISDPNCRVDGIPQHQLQIASLERARQEKGYPTADKLIEEGVPKGLANALAPFQRGGVDFVLEKGGRALIADDMGLGKTIQAIASMSVYHKEWPLLVLCPSSARYHWEGEFQNWLGCDSIVNKPKEGEIGTDEGSSSSSMEKEDDMLLEDRQINVLTSSKDELLPHEDTMVVICSYGLAPMLVESGNLFPKLFRCAIVDESHMLKNKSTKRTSSLLPILNATDRCALLSGTPALARPAELWPQLEILRTSDRHSWWEDEAEFMDKYVKRGGKRERAELHTMLTGTVMIRRHKAEILKTLPRKTRSKAAIHVLNHEQRDEFKELLTELRQSKGSLGNIARQQHKEALARSKDGENPQEPDASVPGSALNATASNRDASTAAGLDAAMKAKAEAENALNVEILQRLSDGRSSIRQSMAEQALQLGLEQRNALVSQLEGELQVELGKIYQERLAQINAEFSSQQAAVKEKENKRTTLLSRLYGLTGTAKSRLVADMLRRWLCDPTKGKVCIFAHHISVLDSIRDLAELSNEEGSSRKYIRIDGSTTPKNRQEQIRSFQSDPSTRVALLGITAAGVAVTLTASSTVWFAELFWTPAIMVQAEDRCHRIGQQAQVRCLYFVAKGTLDEVLWTLIEKKFQDLGEFVEGKEKQKLVIDKTYETEKDLHSMFEALVDMGEDDDAEADDDTGIDQALQLDGDLIHDIQQMEEEERKMLHSTESDEDESDPNGKTDDRKLPAMKEESVLGKTEEEAITLLDDDDGDDEVAVLTSKPPPAASVDETTSKPPPAASVDEVNDDRDMPEKEATPVPASAAAGPDTLSDLLDNSRLYLMSFAGPKLGFQISIFHGRVAVSSMDSLGADSKPRFGDIVVAVNRLPVPVTDDFKMIIQHIKAALSRPPVELTFLEAPKFANVFLEYLEREIGERTKAIAEKNKSAAENVIEIMDD